MPKRFFFRYNVTDTPDFVEQSQKSRMLNNAKMIQLCEKLFYDAEKRALKAGIATKQKQPGSFKGL